MTSVPPDGRRIVTHIVYVPDAERATYVREPGEHVIGDAQIAGLARILGPAIDRVVARRRVEMLKQQPETEA